MPVLLAYYFDTDEKLAIGTNDIKNVGYGILKLIYKELEIDKFWNWKTRNRKMKFSTDYDEVMDACAKTFDLSMSSL